MKQLIGQVSTKCLVSYHFMSAVDVFSVRIEVLKL